MHRGDRAWGVINPNVAYLVRVDLLVGAAAVAAFTVLALACERPLRFDSPLSAAIFLVVTLIFLGTSAGSPSTACRSLRLKLRSLSFPLTEYFSAMVFLRGITLETE